MEEILQNKNLKEWKKGLQLGYLRKREHVRFLRKHGAANSGEGLLQNSCSQLDG